MVYENRTGIGRYGVGMKAAALSMGPVMEVYSWQEPGTIYNMILDVNDIGNNRANLIELPDPQLTDMLPSDVSEILCTPMVFPKNPETQELFVYDPDEVMERLGSSGTIVYIPNCDRLTSQRAQTLAEHATKEMARIYRRQLENGLQLFINNRQVEPFDPMYMTSCCPLPRMRWSGATGAIARCQRVSIGCGRKHRSMRVWRWICGVKPKPKAVNTPRQRFIVHGLDKPGSCATVSDYQATALPPTACRSAP